MLTTIEKFALALASGDRKACLTAGTKMDEEWTGEHSTALADYLGLPVSELQERDIEEARRAYRSAPSGGPGQVKAECPDCGHDGPHDTNGDKQDPQFCCAGCGLHQDVR